MKIAITGASGYVGSSLMETLGTEHEVMGTGHNHAAQNLLPMDVRDSSQVSRILSDYEPQIVVHTAGIVEGNDVHDINVGGTDNVVRAAEQIGAGVVFLSSAAVFNGQEGHFSENSTVGSEETYGQTKIAAEELVLQAKVDHLVVRPSLMVGIAPRTPEGTFSGRLRAALTTETPLLLDDTWKFSPSWLQDLSATIRWWMDNRDAAHLLHVGTTEVTTQLEIGRRVAAALQVDPTLLSARGGASYAHNILDSSRARELGVPLHDLDMVVAGITRRMQEVRHG